MAQAYQSGGYQANNFQGSHPPPYATQDQPPMNGFPRPNQGPVQGHNQGFGQGPNQGSNQGSNQGFGQGANQGQNNYNPGPSQNFGYNPSQNPAPSQFQSTPQNMPSAEVTASEKFSEIIGQLILPPICSYVNDLPPGQKITPDDLRKVLKMPAPHIMTPGFSPGNSVQKPVLKQASDKNKERSPTHKGRGFCKYKLNRSPYTGFYCNKEELPNDYCSEYCSEHFISSENAKALNMSVDQLKEKRSQSAKPRGRKSASSTSNMPPFGAGGSGQFGGPPPFMNNGPFPGSQGPFLGSQGSYNPNQQQSFNAGYQQQPQQNYQQNNSGYQPQPNYQPQQNNSGYQPPKDQQQTSVTFIGDYSVLKTNNILLESAGQHPVNGLGIMENSFSSDAPYEGKLLPLDGQSLDWLTNMSIPIVPFAEAEKIFDRLQSQRNAKFNTSGQSGHPSLPHAAPPASFNSSSQQNLPSLPGQGGMPQGSGQGGPPFGQNGMPGQGGAPQGSGQGGPPFGQGGMPGQGGAPFGQNGMPGQGAMPGQNGLPSLPGQGGAPQASGQGGMPGQGGPPFGQNGLPSLPGQGGAPQASGQGGSPSQGGLPSLPAQGGMPSQGGLPSLPSQGGMPSLPGQGGLPSLPGQSGQQPSNYN